jgi:hypothetical protein
MNDVIEDEVCCTCPCGVWYSELCDYCVTEDQEELA